MRKGRVVGPLEWRRFGGPFAHALAVAAEEVRGEGVVGEKPVLAPGATYDYNSFCHLKTSVGTMHGSYTMVTADGDTFEARIAPFTLAVPYALN